MPDRKLRVFLCHSSTDKPILRELTSDLSPNPALDPITRQNPFLSVHPL